MAETHATIPSVPSTLSAMLFSDVADLWIEQHSRYIKPNTLRTYKFAISVLKRHFGALALNQIEIGDIRRFQVERANRANAYRINSEISIMGMILKEARERNRAFELYKPLRVAKRKAGHSLTAEEEKRLREVALTKTKWQLAARCMIVMLSTTMGFGELRQLRRRDVDMKRRSVTIREGAKNEYRERTIPLNTSAYEALSWIIDRWKTLGGNSDEHYILPHRPRTLKGPWLLDEPMTAIRSAFRSIRKAADLPHFRVYDCRVQAITKLLSNPAVSPQVSKEIAGHISQAMQDRYSIQQFQTKANALDALDGMTPEPAAPEPTPSEPAAPLSMQAMIQAEVQRLVAQAMQGIQPLPAVNKADTTSGLRLMQFPGKKA